MVVVPTPDMLAGNAVPSGVLHPFDLREILRQMLAVLESEDLAVTTNVQLALQFRPSAFHALNDPNSSFRNATPAFAICCHLNVAKPENHTFPG